MLGHDNYDLENHRWDLTHVCSMVPVARIGWALVVTILFGHSLVLFSYPFFSYQLSTLRALLQLCMIQVLGMCIENSICHKFGLCMLYQMFPIVYRPLFSAIWHFACIVKTWQVQRAQQYSHGAFSTCRPRTPGCGLMGLRTVHVPCYVYCVCVLMQCCPRFSCKC